MVVGKRDTMFMKDSDLNSRLLSLSDDSDVSEDDQPGRAETRGAVRPSNDSDHGSDESDSDDDPSSRPTSHAVQQSSRPSTRQQAVQPPPTVPSPSVASTYGASSSTAGPTGPAVFARRSMPSFIPDANPTFSLMVSQTNDFPLHFYYISLSQIFDS